ncbi:MAG: S8 family serine peptidase [Bdellovibrio sp.]|nr:S8 family serine peptidase [Bdellovibrio sp.]
MSRRIELFVLIILSLLFIGKAMAEVWVIELSRPLTTEEIRQTSLEQFSDYPSDYFQRLYRAEAKLSTIKTQLQSISNLQINKAEGVYPIEAQGIIPSPNRPAQDISTDPLLTYQWPVIGSGPQVTMDIDDINYNTLAAGSHVDIGIKNIAGTLAPRLKREVIVAVIDSGIDFNHPDLKGQIKRNETECAPEGGIMAEGTEAEVADNDNNSLHGDCMGWNFMAHKASKEARFPLDDTGHGTHVAGLIAAKANTQGIYGIFPQVKILPIKVMGAADEQNQAATSMTDRLARGLLYAIKMKANVINLSLGWPRSIDTQYLHQAFMEAINQGIVVVAAAGNNNTSSPIFPCAYHHVLCVGATQIDGQLASFSNYGGHVDLVAPGDHILSTYPTNFFPLNFSLTGYEVKNGTSQAAPLVSGASAILKAVLPEITLDELKARLMAGTNPVVDAIAPLKRPRPTLFGTLNIEKSLEATPAPLLAPVFKELAHIPFQAKDKKFFIDLRIKNYWLLAKNIRVQISLPSNLNLEKNIFEIAEMPQSESALLRMNGTLESLEGDHQIPIQVSISAEGMAEKSFNHILPLVRVFKDDEQIAHAEVLLKDEKHRLADIRGGILYPNMMSVSDPYQLLPHPFYSLARIENEGPNFGVRYFFFDLKDGKLSERTESLFILGATRPLALTITDTNYDGRPDLEITTVAKTGKEATDKEFLQFSYFDFELHELFPGKSHWRYTPDTVALNSDKVFFVPAPLPGGTQVATRAFLEVGRLPEIYQKKSAFRSPDRSLYVRLYVLVPEEKNGVITLATKLLDPPAFYEKFRKDFKIKWNDQIAVIAPLVSDRAAYKRGEARILLSVGKGYLRDDYVLTYTSLGEPKVEKMNLQGRRVELDLHYAATRLSPERATRGGADFFVGYQGLTSVKTTALLRTNLNAIQTITSTGGGYYNYPRATDHILGFVGAYHQDSSSSMISIFQTKSRLLFLDEKIKTEVRGPSDLVNIDRTAFDYPIARFSFLPGKLLNDLFFPIISKGESGLRPALFIDNTQINGNRAYILEVHNDQAFVPAKYSFLVPDNCKAMNPVSIQGQAHQLLFLCKYNGDVWGIKSFKLE